MKKRKFIIGQNEREKFIEVFSLLGYSIESETPRNNGLLIIIKKDNDDPNLAQLEKEFIPSIVPLWTLLILAALVIMIMTAYVVIHFAQLWDVDKYIKFLVFFVPAAVLLAVDTLLFFLRSNAINKIARNQPTMANDIKNRLKKD